ncbi:hypothetical protein EGW08_001439 [Elysia chlorotica]|uniref:Palmitoyltransferase n=1 Tax=Elysia chlorotica TaxID=188477 RepID=A0A3S0ZZT4_ELYCH|nr:hypothetical protein EGW08_001439 [Elysia chlorotica]
MMAQPMANSGTQAAAFEMLMNAIASSLTSVIQQLLSSDPSLVLLKVVQPSLYTETEHYQVPKISWSLQGWHGMTPLHRACLIGEYNIVLLLVQANADVNSLTNFKETPLHYASKRGIPSVVHLLLQCGAKIELKDQNGRLALHHAAENGAVDVIRYFQDAYNLDLQTLDYTYQSALHIACNYGQIELFQFLINSGSSDLRQPDIKGNLPIHITASKGYGNMTWTMLCILGVSVLRVTNKAGMTPLDLVSQSDGFGHEELLPVLKHFASQPDSTPVTGPVWMWYARLVFPFTFYLLLIIITQHMASNQYLVFGAAFALVAIWSRNLTHRIHHVSRWPEPIYAGFFYGGVVHTTLCFLWLMLPCYLSTPAKDPVTGKLLTMVDVCQMRNPPYRFCYICDQIVPVDTKHCKLCDRCFVRMDHHCLFLLRCVAKNNHALFVWLLLLGAANMALYCISFALYTSELYGDLAWLEIFSVVIDREVWPLTLLFLNAASFFWSANVLHYQYDCVATGRTAFFNRPPPGFEMKKLTKNEKFMNFCYFLLERPLPHSAFVQESDSKGKAYKDGGLGDMISQYPTEIPQNPDIKVV